MSTVTNSLRSHPTLRSAERKALHYSCLALLINQRKAHDETSLPAPSPPSLPPSVRPASTMDVQQ